MFRPRVMARALQLHPVSLKIVHALATVLCHLGVPDKTLSFNSRARRNVAGASVAPGLEDRCGLGFGVNLSPPPVVLERLAFLSGPPPAGWSWATQTLVRADRVAVMIIAGGRRTSVPAARRRRGRRRRRLAPAQSEVSGVAADNVAQIGRIVVSISKVVALAALLDQRLAWGWSRFVRIATEPGGLVDLFGLGFGVYQGPPPIVLEVSPSFPVPSGPGQTRLC